jgi:diguanylate cyclase (GGDEF)-like protein
MLPKAIRANAIRWKLIALIVAVLVIIGTWFAHMTRHVLVTGDEQFTIGQGIGMSHFYGGIENAESSPLSAINHVASLMHLTKPIPGVSGYGVFLSPAWAAKAHAALPHDGLSAPVAQAIARQYHPTGKKTAWIPYFVTNPQETHIPPALLTHTLTQKKTVWLTPWTHPHLLTLAPIDWHGQMIGVSVVDQIPAERAVPFVNHLMNRNLWLQLAALAGLTVFLYWVIGKWVVRPIRYQAEHDLMTQLYNQMTFWHLFHETAALMANRDLPVAMLTLDMDYFKKVNDTYGHQKGDEVLRTLADIIRRHIRATDIAGRMGGEEFGIVLPGSALAEARQIAENIRRDLATHHVGDQPLTVSIGVAVSTQLSQYGYHAKALAYAADVALYDAKNQGRNRVVCYTPSTERDRMIAQTILVPTQS